MSVKHDSTRPSIMPKGRLIALLILLAIAVISPSRLFGYFSFPISGQVIDGKTGAPLADVLVVAHWEEHDLIRDDFLWDIKVSEAKTNSDGTFRIDGWWKLRLPFPHTLRDRGSPYIRIFKGGYYPKSFSNYSGDQLDLRNGIVQLDKIEGSDEEFEMATWGIGYLFERNCIWREMPELVKTAIQIHQDFPKSQISNNLPDVYRMALLAKSCGQRLERAIGEDAS